MAPANRGEVTEHLWKDGTTMSYGVRVRAYGKRYRLPLGDSRQGWNHMRAEIELERIEQQIQRGTWVPPEAKTTARRSRRDERPDGHQPFGPFARKVVDAKKNHGLADATIEHLEWRLEYLLAEFGRNELAEIDVARVDRFRDELAKRSREIRAAADRGKPLIEMVKGKDGRPYRREKRALSNSSINRLLELLGLIMQRAVDYEYVARNPVRVGERSERFLPTPRKARTYLEVDELKSLLGAAGELDRDVQRSHRIGRRGAIATLGLTGFRISELCEMPCSQVDLPRARFKIPDAKTEKAYARWR
jgi:integrase